MPLMAVYQQNHTLLRMNYVFAVDCVRDKENPEICEVINEVTAD